MNEFQLPPERDFPRGQLERRARHLVSELASSRRRRLLVSLVPAVAILLVAATGFTAYVLRRDEPTHFESIGCFDRADLGANVSIISADGRGAVTQCRELWEKGSVGETAPPRRLAACVLSTGPIGVFPSEDEQTCERLGLADVSVAGAAESRRFVRMRNSIYAEIGTPPSGSSRGSGLCVSEERATAIVRRALDAHGYSAWKVATGQGFSPERPCAQVAFDGASQTVLLIAAARNEL